MEMLKYKYGVFYTDGGWRDQKPLAGGGCGIHGYVFNTLPSVRFAKVGHLVTPSGYEPKMTGPQLKDDSFNPAFTAFGYTKNAKDDPVCKEGADVRIIDAWISIGNQTAQRAELLAFIQLMTSTYVQCEFTTIFVDSNYLLLGITRDLQNWIDRGWKRSNGGDVSNQDLWEKIAVIIKERAGTFSIVKIAAHAGHFGNECADRNATMGVAASANDKIFEDWIDTSIHDNDYWEPEKPLPALLQQKWCYGLTNVKRDKTAIDGVDHSHFFMGDHSKSKDDIELLGKENSDVGFSLVLLKGEHDIIDKARDFHSKILWNGESVLYQSEYMLMVNCATIMKPKSIWELTRGRHECFFMSSSRNDISTAKEEELLSKILRPPRLSFRILPLEDEYKEILYSYLLATGHTLNDFANMKPKSIVLNDVTDMFYETAVTKNGDAGATKLKDFYDLIVKSLEFEVNHPINEKTAKIIMSRGIDLPSRSIMSKIANENPKVTIVTWLYDGIMFNYGMVIECDSGVGIWSGYGSSRVLNEKET